MGLVVGLIGGLHWSGVPRHLRSIIAVLSLPLCDVRSTPRQSALCMPTRRIRTVPLSPERMPDVAGEKPPVPLMVTRNDTKA
jgi:hypothetical protein